MWEIKYDVSDEQNNVVKAKLMLVSKGLAFVVPGTEVQAASMRGVHIMLMDRVKTIFQDAYIEIEKQQK